MTKSELISKMKRIAKDSKDDPEFNHIEADLLLCHVLESVGYEELVKEWKLVTKWFA